MRRSAAEYQTEVESAIHAAFLIEEKIPVDFEEDDDPMVAENTDRSEDVIKKQ